MDTDAHTPSTMRVINDNVFLRGQRDCRAKVLEFRDNETARYAALYRNRCIDAMALKKWIRQSETKFAGALGIS